MANRQASTAVTALGAVAAVGAAALAWGTLVERNRFQIRQEILPLLDEGARPLTVLHLSDLHMAPWQTRKQEWIRSLAVFEPDLVINTGDNFGHIDALDAIEYALAPFQGMPGVFVNGSNDYFGPVAKNPMRYFQPARQNRTSAVDIDTDAMENFFEVTQGWLSLNNTARAMLLKGSRLEFFGVNDAHKNWDRLDVLPGAIDDMRENVAWNDDPADRDVVSIGVTHAPYRRVLDAFVTYGAEAIFAGHTHGGQVRIPGSASALVANCDIPTDQAQGLSVWEHAGHDAYLNVSAGLGTSIYAPVRFACPPEAVLVTLTPRDISYS